MSPSQLEASRLQVLLGALLTAQRRVDVIRHSRVLQVRTWEASSMELHLLLVSTQGTQSPCLEELWTIKLTTWALIYAGIVGNSESVAAKAAKESKPCSKYNIVRTSSG